MDETVNIERHIAALHNKASELWRTGEELPEDFVRVTQHILLPATVEGVAGRKLVLVPREPLETRRVNRTRWDGKVDKSLDSKPAGPLIESLLSGEGEGWDHLNETQAWRKAEEWANELNLARFPEIARSLCRGVVYALVHRSGGKLEDRGGVL